MAVWVPKEAVQALRTNRCTLNNGGFVCTDNDAELFINERGLVPLSDIKGVPLPSLSSAVPGVQPGEWIPDACWRWKEILPAQRTCIYGKFVKNRGVFISWRLFACFYALFHPVDADNDEYATQHTTAQERAIIDVVVAEGAIDSRKLWREVQYVFPDRTHFLRTLEKLQTKYILTVSGGSLEGWSVHEWDLITRHAAEYLQHLPQADEAQQQILLQLVENTVVCAENLAASILRENRRTIHSLAERMEKQGLLLRVQVEGTGGTYWALPGDWA